MQPDRPTTTMDRRRVKRLVIRERDRNMAEDEWLREYLRDPKRREKSLRGTIAFSIAFYPPEGARRAKQP